MSVNYQIIAGQALEVWVDLIGEWRIETFKHFPYLYSGRIEHERKYMQTFVHSSNAFISVAFENGNPIGIVTASPLLADKSIAKGSPASLFAQHGLDPAQFCYLGEVIVQPAYRGRKIGQELMQLAEQELHRRKFNHACLLCVQRSKEHPLRPASYVAPDSLWMRLGYQKTSMTLDFEWLAFEASGFDSLQKHSMEFWIK